MGSSSILVLMQKGGRGGNFRLRRILPLTDYAACRLTALLPFASGWISNDTRWPSFRLRMPAISTAVAWTKTSLPPSSGEMKPKPLVALKNFTVPIVMFFPVESGFGESMGSGRGDWETIENG